MSIGSRLGSFALLTALATGALAQMPGLKLRYANGGSTAWILSPIAPSSFGGTNVYIPEDFERMRGMKEACAGVSRRGSHESTGHGDRATG